jgi:membrane fusion protein, copper/silver efflux system
LSDKCRICGSGLMHIIKAFWYATLMLLISGTIWLRSVYGEEDLSSLPAGSVQISPERQQLIGVKTGLVEKKAVVHTLRVLGRVAPDDTRIYRINASVDGWIVKAYNNSVGTLVKKGEVLAVFSNPQFLDAEQGYLYALGTVERLGPGRRLELGRQEAPNPAALDPFVVQRQIDILRGMGMSDRQIEEIGRNREVTQDIRIISPVEGFIAVRKVSPGERFLKGTELYRIEDLSRVWILADVYEKEVRHFVPGAKARATLPYRRETYQATVTPVLPLFDNDTRTLQVRLETENPGFVLRSGMFVDVELPVTLPPVLTVPIDAILFSGQRETVFVARGDGFFVPRQVETGERLGGRIEIVQGLEPGERVVISGNFFVDSESRLQAVAQGIYGPPVKDPVCGMEVDEARAEAMGRSSTYRGKTYHFCSDMCKQEFDEAPGEFVQATPEEEEHTDHATDTGHDQPYH